MSKKTREQPLKTVIYFKQAVHYDARDDMGEKNLLLAVNDEGQDLVFEADYDLYEEACDLTPMSRILVSARIGYSMYRGSSVRLHAEKLQLLDE